MEWLSNEVPVRSSKSKTPYTDPYDVVETLASGSLTDQTTLYVEIVLDRKRKEEGQTVYGLRIMKKFEGSLYPKATVLAPTGTAVDILETAINKVRAMQSGKKGQVRTAR